MMHFDRRLVSILAFTSTLAGLGACAVASPDVTDEDGARVAETTSSLSSGFVSTRAPDGMILSTGNLYFTTHDDFGASVFRTAQGSSPGQERELFRENVAGAQFGDIVFAQVDGTFLGYFFAQDSAGITIRSVPLAGGPAAVLVHRSNIDIINSKHNLVTDGVNLYWQEDASVLKMSVHGGAITVLDTATPNTPTAGVFLRGDTIVYASNKEVRFVPTAGTTTPSATRILANAAVRVTALRPVPNGVYWGDNNGAVQLQIGPDSVTTIQGNNPFLPLAIASDAPAPSGLVSWTDCTSDSCRLHIKSSSITSSSIIGAGALGLSISGSGALYWGDSAGVHRKVL